ncbi:leucine Rich Repeat [Seminavis robusta]|uniref:Leucine Rich Repeat n=1 Tax=Seminavis robusta TaxID=568900 RepID=A0A9N8H3W9_9STRA|nr:leucine Rich Repeat [Seminavis robusta]|eukprot:Sro71_g039300.1 leucine Rich Repeat (673) ;mRNA; r:39813-41957
MVFEEVDVDALADFLEGGNVMQCSTSTSSPVPNSTCSTRATDHERQSTAATVTTTTTTSEQLVVATLVPQESSSTEEDDEDDTIQVVHVSTPATINTGTTVYLEAKPLTVRHSLEVFLCSRKGRWFVAGFLLLIVVVVGGITLVFLRHHDNQHQSHHSNDDDDNNNNSSTEIEIQETPELRGDAETSPSVILPIDIATINITTTNITNITSNSTTPTTPLLATVTPSPTNPPTTELEGYVRSLLYIPATQMALRNASSPQSKALQWLLQDIEYRHDDSNNNSTLQLLPYSEQRARQRFALATLFYATRGVGWQFQQHWLRQHDSIHECQWYTSLSHETTTVSPCDDQDQFVRLVLIGNILQGTIPPDLGYLTSLVELRLQGDNFFNRDYQFLQGTIPHELGERLTQLQFLDLSKNGLTGSIPHTLAHLTQLEVLLLLENQLSGTIPLALLSCHYNDNNNTLVELEKCPMQKLQEIRLYSNLLTGTLPATEWTRSLTVLDWSNNLFTGTLPTELAALPALRVLDLQNCLFTGVLPTTLGTFAQSQLEFLKLNDNRFTGVIPSELGQVSSLKWLLLKQNHLVGTIPTELGGLMGVAWLLLNHNRLSGTIPTEFGQLNSVRFLRLHENDLTGQVPQDVCTLQANNWWFFLIQVDCDEVACDCRLCLCEFNPIGGL